MVVQCLDGQRVLAFCYADGKFPQCLLAEHVELPTLRAERLLEAKRLRLTAVDSHREAQVALVVRLCGNESQAQKGFAFFLTFESVGDCLTFWQAYGIHRMSQRLDADSFLVGIVPLTGVTCDEALVVGYFIDRVV